MVLFLTSNIGGIKKENDKKFLVSFFEKNAFLTNLKENLKNNRKFVLVASNPTNFEQNDLFLNMDIEALKLSGMTFEEYVVLDNRNKNDVVNVLKNSDLIFLCGGNTFIQNTFFNEIHLGKHIKSVDSVIVGISAGSINAAENVYNSPEDEEDLNNPLILKGLGITNINIEPHFELNVDNDNKLLQREITIKESFNRKIYALTDGAYILETSNSVTIYGKSYIIHKGEINIICDDNQSIELNND